MKKQITFLLSLLIMIALLGACSDEEAEKDKEKDQEKDPGTSEQQEVEFPEFDKSELTAIDTIAEYEGGVVTGEEFAQYLAVEAFMNPMAPLEDQKYRNQGVKYLVMEKALAKEVEDKSWAKEQADKLWEQVTLTYDEDTREKGFEKLGITEDDVKNYITNFYVVQDYFRSDITDEDVKTYYEDIKPSLTTASFRHILIATKETDAEGNSVEKRTDEEALEIIKEIQTKLDEGESFADLATEYTEDPGSKETGGLYEDSQVATLAPAFADAVISQELNVIGEPVKTMFGYHLIIVEKRDTRSFEEVEEPIIQQLAFEKSNDYLVGKVPGMITKIDESLKEEKKEEDSEE